MRIDIKRLEDNGFIVDQDKREGTITIYPANGNSDLFMELSNVLQKNTDMKVRDCEMMGESITQECNNKRILQLCE